MVQRRFDIMGSHSYLRSVAEGHPDIVFDVNCDVVVVYGQAFVLISFPLSPLRS